MASGFESYLVALCFILWKDACTGSYRTRSYDKQDGVGTYMARFRRDIAQSSL